MAWDNGSQHPAARTAASPAVTRLLHPAVTRSHSSFSTNRCSSMSDAMRRCRFQKGWGGTNPSPTSMCRNHQSLLLHRFLVDVAPGGKGPVEEALSDLLFLGTRATPRQWQSLHARKPFAVFLTLAPPGRFLFPRWKTSDLLQQSPTNPRRRLPDVGGDSRPREGFPGTALGMWISREPLAGRSP